MDKENTKQETTNETQKHNIKLTEETQKLIGQLNMQILELNIKNENLENQVKCLNSVINGSNKP